MRDDKASEEERALHPILMKFLDWTPDWEDLDPCAPFPIRDMGHDVTGYLAANANFVVRDRKYLVQALSLDVDPCDEIGFFDALLDRTEKEPWIWPLIESFVANSRILGLKRRHFKRREMSKKDRIIHKMPITRLRLKRNPDLLDRLGEIMNPGGAPEELLTAIFFEYALYHYFALSNEEHAMKYAEIFEIGNEQREKSSYDADDLEVSELDELLESDLPDADHPDDNVEDSEELRRAYVCLARIDDGEIGQDLRDEVLSALRALIQQIEVGEIPRNLEVLGDLATRSVEIFEEVSDADLTDRIERLLALGIPCDPASLGDEARGVLGSEEFPGQIQVAERLRHEALAADGEAKDLANQINAAVKEEDYSLVAELAPRVSRAKEVASQSQAAFAQICESLTIALRIGDPQGLDQGLGEAPVDQGGERSSPTDAENMRDAEDVSGPESTQSEDLKDSTCEEAGEPAIEDAQEENEPATAQSFDEQDQSVEEPQPLSDIAGAGSVEEEPASESRRDLALNQSLDPEDVTLLRRLLDHDQVGLAAELANAVEAAGKSFPIHSDHLRVAAAARMAFGDYGPEADRIRAMVTDALPRATEDDASVLLFGALLQPVISWRSLHDLRAGLGDLCGGPLGSHLMPIGEAVAELDFDFPPSPDVLAQLAGGEGAPARVRIARKLGDWCKTVSKKTSRWPFATLFMHHAVSESGPIGKACKIMAAKGPVSADELDDILASIADTSEIHRLALDFAASINRDKAGVHPKGLEYLDNLFSEARAMMTEWMDLGRREPGGDARRADRTRTTVANLKSRIAKAIDGLRAISTEDPLTGSLSSWLIRRLKDALTVLEGGEVASRATVEDAISGDMDLLPADVRNFAGSPDVRLLRLRHVLEQADFDPRKAIEQACSEGAFETASRLDRRYALDVEGAILDAMVAFAEDWTPKLEARERRLRGLVKVDYAHQDELGGHIEYCVSRRAVLEEIRKKAEMDDLDDLPTHLAEIDKVAAEIETKIREDQVERVAQYRTEHNEDDVNSLLFSIGTLSIEAIEDRIAQLRDGRSAATFDMDLEGSIGSFTREFLPFAASAAWPGSHAAFTDAVAKEGPLFVEEDRRRAATRLIETYREISISLQHSRPNIDRIRLFLEEIGFTTPKVGKPAQIGSAKAWMMRISGTIRSDGWFLPPVFGSRAKENFNLVLVGLDILPETIRTALGPDQPTLLLLSGVADPARRHEFAQRLRAGIIPALLIDEALVAYAAIRRDTRARTIFECGLPYGRVEPYTTDAGAIPVEMFFGREAEIRDILSDRADGCLVYGGRQLGKSALLSHIADLHHDESKDRIVLRREVKALGKSEKPEEIWRHLHSMLSEFRIVRQNSRSAEDISRDIQNWLVGHPDGRILCMFDETDNFLAADTKNDFPEISRLKDLMTDTDRGFKVVFAGLHNVQRMNRQPNSPLAHLGRAICIGPLNQNEDDRRAAYELVVNPMRAAGFRFESIEAVEQILAWSNYYPSLVQEYAKGFLSTLHGLGSGKQYKLDRSGPLWTIPTSELFQHRGFREIQTRVRDKFYLTLDLDPRYALVAYTLAWLVAEGEKDKALTTGYRSEELLEHARGFWPRQAEEPTPATFEVLLDELFDLGVLGRLPIPGSQRHRYCLRSSHVAAMLGSQDDILHALAELEAKDPAVSYDRAIHRRRYGKPGKALSALPAEWLYSPLTDLQIERILPKGRDDPGLRLVCGLQDLGLSRVPQAIEWLAKQGSLPGPSQDNMEIFVAGSRREMAQVINRERGGKRGMTLVFRHPETAHQANEEIEWLDGRPTVISGEIRPVLLLDALNQSMRDLAARRERQTEYLSAWGAEMIRVHLNNAEQNALDTRRNREEILRLTGGIPPLIMSLIGQMINVGAEEAFVSWRQDDRLARSLEGTTIEKALKEILEVDTPEDYRDVEELVNLASGKDLTSIGPDLQAIGLIAGWNPQKHRVRLSALGELVSRQAKTTISVSA